MKEERRIFRVDPPPMFMPSAQAAANLKGVLDHLGGRQAVIIVREYGEPIVVVPLSVWSGTAEEDSAN